MEDKSPQVTYLFGAGASAMALPTIKALPQRMLQVKNFIDEKYIFEDDDVVEVGNGIQVNKIQAKKQLLEGFQRLIEVCESHSTIDTYAKKLYINSKHNEAEKLTFFLSLYFNIEQKISGIDPRYDTFLVSILDSNAYKFPPNIKFLTWNYDLQMEAAHEKLSERGSGDLSNELFLKTDLDRLRKNEFLSIKINGTCCFKHNGYRGVYRIVKNLMNPECGPDDLDMALAYCQLHLTEGRKVYQASNMLKFAWYQDYGFLNKVCELCDETQVLVVIGYSFPFFNREIDRKIIRSMKALKKIYIQDRYPENISSRFLSILPGYKEHGIEIIPISDLSEFFLPPEL